MKRDRNTHTNTPIARRTVLTGLGCGLMTTALRMPASAASRFLNLKAESASATLRLNQPASEIWTLTAEPSERLARGDTLRVNFTNRLSAPVVLAIRGLDGVPEAEPLLAQAPIAPGGPWFVDMNLRRAGTMLCDLRLLGDGQWRPSATRALIVDEAGSSLSDRDENMLIEDWRIGADGNALAPGRDAGSAVTAYTVNGKLDFQLNVKVNERLRLRLINGCQRAIVALRIENQTVRVMAIDGQPAEPFTARDGQLLMAPGTRTDVLIDVAGSAGSASSIMLFDGVKPATIARLVISNDAPVRPSPLATAAELPSNGLPVRLDMKSALRANVSLADTAGWIAPSNMSAKTPPSFRVKRGRIVVLTISNPADRPMTFHLHGHHFRLLDRLDDGWKPFWLDTLAFDARQTQRIAFLAEYSGGWLMEAMGVEWSSPRRVQIYAVE